MSNENVQGKQPGDDRRRLIAAIDGYVESELARRDSAQGYWGQRCTVLELKVSSLRVERSALESQIVELKARVEALEGGAL